MHLTIRIKACYDLFRLFTQVRAEDARWGGFDTGVGGGVIYRFGCTAKAFYKRCREVNNPSCPAVQSAAQVDEYGDSGFSPSVLVAPSDDPHRR